MKTADVVAYYGTYEAVGQAVGITKAGVWMWPERVPQAHAYKLQVLTGGKLRVDPSMYPAQKRRAKSITSKARNPSTLFDNTPAPRRVKKKLPPEPCSV
jgi:hypothetical protein